MTTPPVRVCSVCKRPPRKALRRGMCESDYFKARRDGTLENHPRTTTPSAVTVAEWEKLRDDEGLTAKQAAARMEIPYETLRVAISRHRKHQSRGDTQ